MVYKACSLWSPYRSLKEPFKVYSLIKRLWRLWAHHTRFTCSGPLVNIQLKNSWKDT